MIASRYYQRRTNSDPNSLVIAWATDAHIIAEADGNPDHEEAVSSGNRFYYTAGQKIQHFVDDVNNLNPHLVFFSGDMVDGFERPGSVDLFMSKWNQIDVNIRKELTIGNHDLAYTPQYANTTMAQAFGYGDKPIVAGSKYNQSFYIDNGHHRVKIISVDTNIDETGVHVVRTKQMIKEPIRNWIKDEMLNSETATVIMMSHGGAADNESHFNIDDQAEFITMINSVKSQRPELDLYSLFGHSHRQGLRSYSTLGTNIKSYSITPVVDFTTGGYAVVTINEQGVNFEIKEVRYPYP